MAQRPIHDMEAKWQAFWEKNGTYRAQDPSAHPTGEKFYGLVEFPYPSGDGLHVGHPRSYTAIDVVTRKQRMEGKNVLYPIGWDAFGLPTENYAIKNKIKPVDATKKNVGNFTRQIKSLGFGFDWAREVNTTDPEYFKWTQWQFLQFVKAGLAYKAVTTINWCPKDKIGLANEEAQGGVCERCGTAVEKREKAQWMIKITKYSERLIKDLETVDYLERIKKQQIDWIGKSEGAEIAFRVEGSKEGEEVRVFTTRPDTLFGVTYVVLAPEHAFVQQWMKAGMIQNQEEVRAYIEQVKNKTDIERTAENKEKTGVQLKGMSVVNPANGETVPVWIADYALANYGTGAVMAVPAHDERDFAFAKKYELPIKYVVAPCVTISSPFDPKEGKAWSKVKSVVTAIIYRPRTDEYLVISTSDDRRLFVGGGVDEGETPEQAIIREVQEETGYLHPTIVSVVIPALYARGYKPRKDINCFDWDRSFYIELQDETLGELAEEDKTNHELIWKKADEVADFLNIDSRMRMWGHFQEKRSPCFTEEGFMLESSFLDGLPNEEAKNKIVEWLEEKGLGKKVTTYRLRDWVFSRQRYWGEPIPLVHCKACATKKQKALLVHGYGGRHQTVNALRIKEELERAGFEVMAPVMSTSDVPVFDKWMEELRPYAEQLGEDDIIIGTSLGGHAAVSLLNQLKKKIGSLFLIAPAIGDYSSEEYWVKRKVEQPNDQGLDALKAFLNIPVDLVEASKYADRKVVIWSQDDTRVQEPTHGLYPAGWYIFRTNGYGHFNKMESPELIDLILSSKINGWNSVPETQLPVTLPDVGVYEPTDTGESPLANIKDWVNTTCPKCGGPAERETDTMPNWAGSSWYFLRYCDPQNKNEFASAENLKYWMPVNLYNGGMEHTTLHLLYSRFWHKFLWDMGYIPTECGSEPYSMRRSHNMILGEGGVKMSKSKGNVVNPDDVVKDYGADVFRLYEMFIGPYDQPAPWDTNGIEGVRRFLDKVWNLFEAPAVPTNADLETLYHQTVKKVTDGIDSLQFNTCISQMMILTNAFQDAGGIPTEYRQGFLQILAPYAPHITEELWQMLGHKDTIHRAGWPVYDASKLVGSTFELVIQINGKVRDKMVVEMDISEEEAKAKVLASEKVQGWLEGKEPKKVVYVKGKLVSIVI